MQCKKLLKILALPWLCRSLLLEVSGQAAGNACQHGFERYRQQHLQRAASDGFDSPTGNARRAVTQCGQQDELARDFQTGVSLSARCVAILSSCFSLSVTAGGPAAQGKVSEVT